jgi:hypothetical protein
MFKLRLRVRILGLIGNFSLFHVSPECDQQLSGHRHSPDPSHADVPQANLRAGLTRKHRSLVDCCPSSINSVVARFEGELPLRALAARAGHGH